MGTTNSGDNNRKLQEHQNNQANSKFENLIYESNETSSGTQRTENIDPPQFKIKLKNQNKELLLNEKASICSSGKKMQREDSVITNYDKLSMKSSKISKLNEILDKQIKTYQKQQKQRTSKGNIRSPSQPAKKVKRKKTQPESVMMGVWIGITISIVVVLIVIVQINNLSIANESQFSRDFPTWRGIAIWIFYVWMLGFDIYMYQRHKVRYRQILKIAPDHYPEPVNIFRIAGFHSSVFVVLFLFYVLEITNIYHVPGFAVEYYALISWGLFVGFLFLPVPILSNKGRFFVFSLLIDSVFSPFRGVTFPITWMTDQAVSMAVPLKDLEYTICYYTELDFKSTTNTCLDTNRVSTVMIVAVSICSIRMVQCIRQGYDKGEFFMTPFFFNTLKYAATLCTAVFAFQYKLGADEVQAAWLLFAIISSFYSFVWDLKMDWGLLEKNDQNPFLREKLIFGSAKVYYLILVGNFLMRLAWIITISPKLAAFLGNNNLVFLVTGMIEIFRRGVWNLLRVEKEHLALVSKPPKNNMLELKAIELEKKLANVENSLNLQIKMLKFFNKFENNRDHLKFELQRFHETDLEKDQILVETYNQQFHEEEMKQISGLMEEILKADSSLKKKINDQDTENITTSQKNAFKGRLLDLNENGHTFTSQIRQAEQKFQEAQQIKAQLKEFQDLIQENKKK